MHTHMYISRYIDCKALCERADVCQHIYICALCGWAPSECYPFLLGLW